MKAVCDANAPCTASAKSSGMIWFDLVMAAI